MPVAIALPAFWKIIGYGAAAIIGSFGAWYIGKFLVGWINESFNKTNADSATDGRTVADQSDQTLNGQLGKLPED